MDSWRVDRQEFDSDKSHNSSILDIVSRSLGDFFQDRLMMPASEQVE